MQSMDHFRLLSVRRQIMAGIEKHVCIELHLSEMSTKQEMKIRKLDGFRPLIGSGHFKSLCTWRFIRCFQRAFDDPLVSRRFETCVQTGGLIPPALTNRAIHRPPAHSEFCANSRSRWNPGTKIPLTDGCGVRCTLRFRRLTLNHAPICGNCQIQPVDYIALEDQL